MAPEMAPGTRRKRPRALGGVEIRRTLSTEDKDRRPDLIRGHHVACGYRSATGAAFRFFFESKDVAGHARA